MPHIRSTLCFLKLTRKALHSLVKNQIVGWAAALRIGVGALVLASIVIGTDAVAESPTYYVLDVSIADIDRADWTLEPHPGATRSPVFDELALLLCKELTATPPKEPSTRLHYFLSSEDVFNAIRDTGSLARDLPNARSLHAVVRATIVGGVDYYDIRIVNVVSKTGVVLYESVPVSVPKDQIFSGFQGAVANFLRDLGIPAATEISHEDDLPWDHRLAVLTSRLERRVGRRLGRNLGGREAYLLDQALRRLKDLPPVYRSHPLVVAETLALVSRQRKLGATVSPELQKSLRETLAKLVEEGRAGWDVQVSYYLTEGSQRIYKSDIEPTQADPFFDRALALNPNLSAPIFFRAHRALRDLEAGRPTKPEDEILKKFDEALVRNPLHMWAMVYKGRMLGFLQRWGDAQAVLGQALDSTMPPPLVAYQAAVVTLWEREALVNAGATPENERLDLLSKRFDRLLAQARRGVSFRSAQRLRIADRLLVKDHDQVEALLIEKLARPQFQERYAKLGQNPAETVALFEDFQQAMRGKGTVTYEDKILLTVLAARSSNSENAVSLASDLIHDFRAGRQGLSDDESHRYADVWLGLSIAYRYLGLPNDAEWAAEHAMRYLRP